MKNDIRPGEVVQDGGAAMGNRTARQDWWSPGIFSLICRPRETACETATRIRPRHRRSVVSEVDCDFLHFTPV